MSTMTIDDVRRIVQEARSENRAADLSNMGLSNMDLSGANLADANLSGANLRITNLSGANLRGAITDN